MHGRNSCFLKKSAKHHSCCCPQVLSAPCCSVRREYSWRHAGRPWKLPEPHTVLQAADSTVSEAEGWRSDCAHGHVTDSMPCTRNVESQSSVQGGMKPALPYFLVALGARSLLSSGFPPAGGAMSATNLMAGLVCTQSAGP
jgi:hypothetical protein